MEVTNSFVDRQTVGKKVTRSRFHYRPISSSELLLTIVLSTFIGMGLFIATVINPQPEDANSKMPLPILQDTSLAEANLIP